MTYRLELVIGKMECPAMLVFPDSKKRQYNFGAEACDDIFEYKYVIKSMRTVDNHIEIKLSEADSLNGAETFF